MGARQVHEHMLVTAAMLIAVCAATAGMLEVILAYPRLPSTMPLRFNLRGEPGNSGPKLLFACLFTALSVFVLAETAVMVLVAAPAARGSHTGTAIVAAGTLAFLAYVQHAIIVAVRQPGGRLAMRPFWTAVLALLVVSIVAARV